MEMEFRKFTDFPRGTLYDILQDAYSFDSRNREIWDANWHESDDFFYDNPQIADNCGPVTCMGSAPIGFVTWDPRHRPEYVEIGHNGIREITSIMKWCFRFAGEAAVGGVRSGAGHVLPLPESSLLPGNGSPR